jgi:hypothetical protein
MSKPHKSRCILEPKGSEIHIYSSDDVGAICDCGWIKRGVSSNDLFKSPNLPNLSLNSATYEELKKRDQLLTGGIKHDSDKVRLELLSSEWINGVGSVLTFGAKKYADHNWRKGINISRLLGACLRHVFSFLKGEDNDPETGLSHLYHASCCLMFASELYKDKPELDDRYKLTAPSVEPMTPSLDE